MSIDEMKGVISSVYTGPKWKDKVACMDDGQVVAVYRNFLARGLIGKVVEYTPPKGLDRLTEIVEERLNDKQSYGDHAVQLTIYDILEREQNN